MAGCIHPKVTTPATWAFTPTTAVPGFESFIKRGSNQVVFVFGSNWHLVVRFGWIDE
jgi:hypothetical protein